MCVCWFVNHKCFTEAAVEGINAQLRKRDTQSAKRLRNAKRSETVANLTNFILEIW
jgi:hypothetical protein